MCVRCGEVMSPVAYFYSVNYSTYFLLNVTVTLLEEHDLLIYFIRSRMGSYVHTVEEILITVLYCIVLYCTALYTVLHLQLTQVTLACHWHCLSLTHEVNNSLSHVAAIFATPLNELRLCRHSCSADTTQR